jgi:hypothetical protein
MSEIYQPKLQIHQNIIKKLDGFITSSRIPHILFHGSSGTGKKTIVYDFVNKIYNEDKSKIRTNVMYVNCAHGKGIKFIRDELKFFAKTNIQGTKGILFKTIVLFNADSLTIDAQSAMRRCIESFSHNTRFFIVVENKHKMLNPILSRFCEIYIPDNIDDNSKLQNLHQYHLEQIYGRDDKYIEWFNNTIDNNLTKKDIEWVEIANKTYENGYSTIDFINWIKQTTFLTKMQCCDMVMYFHKIKSEYRNEKLLLLTIFTFLKNM